MDPQGWCHSDTQHGTKRYCIIQEGQQQADMTVLFQSWGGGDQRLHLRHFKQLLCYLLRSSLTQGPLSNALKIKQERFTLSPGTVHLLPDICPQNANVCHTSSKSLISADR